MNMVWDVELTAECEAWYESLTEAEQDSIARAIDLLTVIGPSLSRPQVDTVKGSRFPNMKELRAQHQGRPYRMLFAFDPRRVALILLGGDKTGDARWYVKAIPVADALYEEHLKEIDGSK